MPNDIIHLLHQVSTAQDKVRTFRSQQETKREAIRKRIHTMELQLLETGAMETYLSHQLSDLSAQLQTAEQASRHELGQLSTILQTYNQFWRQIVRKVSWFLYYHKFC